MRTGLIGEVEDADNRDNETFAPACMLESTGTMRCVSGVGSVVQHTGSTTARPSEGSILFLRQLVA
jgi:hypothetical protein